MVYPDRELLKLLPRVLRARDFHLYLDNGKRLTDLWLQGGRAVLGHKPSRVLLELKNAAERGLFTSLPHHLERRFIKALEEFFPGRAFRLYLDNGSLCRAIEKAGIAGGVSIWRPFMEVQKKPSQKKPSIEPQEPQTEPQTADTASDGETPLIRPVLPWPLGPEVLALEKSLDASFPAGELIPPVLLAPAARALYNLAAAIKAPGQNRLRYQKIEMALGNQKADRKGGSPWQQNGIYLTVEQDMKMEEYKILFLRFLEGGFLIPPSPLEPLILPALMSKGEEAKLAELLKGWRNKD